MKGCLNVLKWIGVAIGGAILLIIVVGAIATTTSSSKASSSAANLTDAQVRTLAKLVTYEQLMRTPELYEGRPVKFEGEVVQADDGRLRVMVDNKEDEYATDAVYVQYDHQFKILTDDEVTVYGIANGRYSYTTVMGAEMTVPGIIATSVDVK